jgi:hypothetical protein
MSPRLRRLAPVAFAVVTGSLRASAQTAAAQDSARVTPFNFVFSRFASRTSNTLYAGYGIGRAMVVAGMVMNPRTGYREHVVGGGVQVLPGRRNSANLVLAAADARESAYLQLYLVPALGLGPASISATIEGYQPLERAGTRQLGFNPVTITVPAWRRFAAGATTVVFLGEGESPQYGLGPALTAGFPKGSVGLDLVQGVSRFRSEARLSFFVRF